MRAVLWITLIVLCLGLTACAGWQPRPSQGSFTPTPVPQSGVEVLYQTVQKTDWLVTASILAAGLGVFAFLNGNGVGLKLLVTALIVLSIVLAVARFSILIAGCTMVAAAILLGYTIWVKSTAIREIVAGGEFFKQGTDDQSHIEWFKACHAENQKHKSTEAIVDAYKNSISK